MLLKDIKKRASRERKVYDNIGWAGNCARCGAARIMLSDDIKKYFNDIYADARELEITCSSPRCSGRISKMHRMKDERAIHLNDIKRRK